MASASWTDMPADVLAVLRRGAVLPAHPLALDEARKFDRRRSARCRATTSMPGPAGWPSAFTPRNSRSAMLASTGRCWSLPPRPLGLGQAAADHDRGRDWQDRTGRDEARTARSLGYHAVLLGLGAMKGASEDEIVEHCATVAREMPMIGFYLQTAVGGIPLSRSFWTRFAASRT